MTTPRGVVELHDLEVDASVSIVRGAITAAVAAVGMSDSHHVSAIAFARFAGGELAVPVAAASLDQARATVVGAQLALHERTPVVTCAIAAQIPVEVAKLFGVALPANAALVASARPDGSVDGLRAGGGPSESAVSVNALAAVGDATVRVMARARVSRSEPATRSWSPMSRTLLRSIRGSPVAAWSPRRSSSGPITRAG